MKSGKSSLTAAFSGTPSGNFPALPRLSLRFARCLVGENSPPDCFLPQRCACSLLVRFPGVAAKNAVFRQRFLAPPAGIFRRCRAYRLASLVAPSAKTVPRTVFFRSAALAPSLFDSRGLQQKTPSFDSVFWHPQRESNPQLTHRRQSPSTQRLDSECSKTLILRGFQAFVD